MNQNILVLAAHPDDEVLGMGGTIAKYSHDNSVYVSFLGEGLFSREKAAGQKSKGDALKRLRKCSEKAGKILGVKDINFNDFPDNSFDRVPFLKIVKYVEKEILRVTPRIIYTHFYADLNLDHCLTFEAALTAARPAGQKNISGLFCFETISSTEWQAPAPERSFNPNLFEDIERFIGKKKAALREYKSEIRAYPHPRSPEGLEVVARYWGLKSGLAMAEPFWTVRETRAYRKL
jgi:LmbE family N-acetylglucosaminyl deacetylase